MTDASVKSSLVKVSSLHITECPKAWKIRLPCLVYQVSSWEYKSRYKQGKWRTIDEIASKCYRCQTVIIIWKALINFFFTIIPYVKIIYYPTLLPRVQIKHKTSTNITIFVLVLFPCPRERLKALARQNFGKENFG